MLELKNLHFSYKKEAFLKELNLHLRNGEFLGILGPNGSGKSTLFKIILRHLPYEKGEIFILRKNLKEYNIKEFSRLIGFVPQNSSLKTPLKVVDVLLMAKYANLKYFFSNYTQKDLDEIKELAGRLKLEKFLQREILTLSGGEFQKVLLARALLKNPKILFLDEPTSSLDLNYAIEFLRFCETLVKKRKISVVAILHDLNLASLFCDSILFLKEGQIRYQGKVNELFRKEILKEIYNLSCEVIYKDSKPYILALKEKK